MALANWVFPVLEGPLLCCPVSSATTPPALAANTRVFLRAPFLLVPVGSLSYLPAKLLSPMVF